MSQNVSAGCPQCLRALAGAGNRLVTDACGHRKCRECLLSEEDGCSSCKRAAGESSLVARSVGAEHLQASDPPAGAAGGRHGSAEGVPPAPDGDVTLVRTRRQCSGDVVGTRVGRRSRPAPRRRTPGSGDGGAGAACIVSTGSTANPERHRHVPRDNTGNNNVAAMSSQMRQTKRMPVETEGKPLWMSLHRHTTASVVPHSSVISASNAAVVVLSTAAPEPAHCVSGQAWSNSGAGPSRFDGSTPSSGARCSVVGAAAGSQGLSGRATVRLALPRVVLLPQQPAHGREQFTQSGRSRRGAGPPLMIPLSLVRAAGNDASAGRQQSGHSPLVSAEGLPQSSASARDPSPAESAMPGRRREVLVVESVSVAQQDRHSTRDTTVSGVAGMWRQSAEIVRSSPDVLGREDRRASAELVESTPRPSPAASVANSNTERVTWTLPAAKKGPVVSKEYAERVVWVSQAATRGPVVSTVLQREVGNPAEVGSSRPPAGIPLAVATSCTYTRPGVSFGTSPTAVHAGVVPVNTPAAHPQRGRKRECAGEDSSLAVKRTCTDQDPAAADAGTATVRAAPAEEHHRTLHAPPGRRLRYSSRRLLGSLPLQDADADDPGVAMKPSSSAGFPVPASQLSSVSRPGQAPEALPAQREYVLSVGGASQSLQSSSGSPAAVAAERQPSAPSRSVAEPGPGDSEAAPAGSPPPPLPRTKKARILAQLHREGTAGSAAAALPASGDDARTRDSRTDGVRVLGRGEAQAGSSVQQRSEDANTSIASAAQFEGLSNFLAISKNEEGSKNLSSLSSMSEVAEKIGAPAEEPASASAEARPDGSTSVRNERIVDTAAETRRSSVEKPVQDACDKTILDDSVKQAADFALSAESEADVLRKTQPTEVDLCNDAAKEVTKEGGQPSQKGRSSRSGKSSKKITAAMVAKKVEKEEGSKPEYQCLVCHKRFGTFSHWKYHISCRIGKFRFRCKLCSWKGNTRQHFNYHMARHKGTPASYCCTVCPAKFLQKSTLDRHMATHSQGNALECSVCSAKFTCPYNHQRHMRTHTGERPFACKVCQRAFSDQGNLKKHEKSHTGGAERQCPVCPARRVFRSAATLTQHLRECHGLPQPGQRHACLTCNKQFSRRSDLHRHQRIHSEEKEFCCPMCRVTSRRLDTLSRHMAAAHGLSREEARAQARRAAASGEQRPPQPTPQAAPEAEADSVSGARDGGGAADETAGVLDGGASLQPSGVAVEAADVSGGAVQPSGDGVAQSASETDELFRTGGTDGGWETEELGGILRENDPSEPLVLDGTTEAAGVSELQVQATSAPPEGQVSGQSAVTGLPAAGEPRPLSALLPAGEPTPRLTAFRAVVPGQHRRPRADAGGWRRHSVVVPRPAAPDPPRLAELRPVRLQPATGPPPSAAQLIHQHTAESAQMVYQHTGESTHVMHQHTGESAELMHQHTGKSAQLVQQHMGESAHVMNQHTGESTELMHQHMGESTELMHQHTDESSHVMHHHMGELSHLVHQNTGGESAHLVHQHTGESARLAHQHTGESAHLVHQHTGESDRLAHQHTGESAHLVHQHTGESAQRMLQHIEESAQPRHDHGTESAHLMHHLGGESTPLHQQAGGPLAEQAALQHVPGGAPLYEVRCYGDAAYGQEGTFIQDLSGGGPSERGQRDGGSLPQQQRHRRAAPPAVSGPAAHGQAADVPPGWVVVPAPSEPPWVAEQAGYPPPAAAAARPPVHSAGTPPVALGSPHSAPSPDRAAQLTSSQNHLRQLIGGTAFDGLSAMFDNLRKNVVACMAARGRGGRPPP